MIKNLIALANRLDQKGFTKEADFLDNIIKKIALTEEDFMDINNMLNISIKNKPGARLGALELMTLRDNLMDLLIEGPKRSVHGYAREDDNPDESIPEEFMKEQIKSEDLYTFNVGVKTDNRSRPNKRGESFSVKLNEISTNLFDTRVTEDSLGETNITISYIIPSGYSDSAKRDGIKAIKSHVEKAVEDARVRNSVDIEYSI